MPPNAAVHVLCKSSSQKMIRRRKPSLASATVGCYYPKLLHLTNPLGTYWSQYGERVQGASAKPRAEASGSEASDLR